MVSSTLISLVWSAKVSDSEKQILKDTVDQVLDWLFLRHPESLADRPIQAHAFGDMITSVLGVDMAYWGTQVFVDSSYDLRLQRVIAPTFLELVRRGPAPPDLTHLELALLHQDLTDFPAPLARLRPEHYSLGSSFPGETAVISVYHLRELADEDVRALALARLVRHHLGHLLQVPQFGRKKHVERLGLETHCTNRCVMRHAAMVTQLAEYALKEAETGWGFCDECTRGLHSIVAGHEHSLN